MVPQFDRKTQTIKAWKVTNSLQSRRAMAQMVMDRFKELRSDVAS